MGASNNENGQLKTWSVLQQELKFLMGVVVTLLAIILVMAINLSMTKTQTVVVPSHLSEEIRIVGNEVNEGYKKIWALFVSKLAGNVTPANVDFVIDNISNLLSPGVYTSLNADLKQQSESIKMRNITINFNEKDIYYSKEKDMVWVFGERIVNATGAKRPRKSIYTYELKVESRHGLPYISYFNGYKGKPLINDQLREKNTEKLDFEEESEDGTKSKAAKTLAGRDKNG